MKLQLRDRLCPSHTLFLTLFQLLLSLTLSSSFSPLLPVFKTPNSFKWSGHWTEALCSQAIQETRLDPPKECERFLEKLNFNISTRISKTILITGSARSGTTMVAAMTSLLGIPISNDAQPPTEYGTASWYLASPSHIDPNCPGNNTQAPKLVSAIMPKNPKYNSVPQYPPRQILGLGKQRNLLRFRNIFHQVRNPLECIPSLVTEIPHWKKCRSTMNQIVPNMNFSLPREVFALQMWVEWNKRLDQYPFIPVHRVEDFNLVDMLMSSGFVYKKDFRMTDSDYICAYQKFKGHNSRQESSNDMTIRLYAAGAANKQQIQIPQYYSKRIIPPGTTPYAAEYPALPHTMRQRTDENKQLITWTHFYMLNSTLTLEAMDMAYRYGYRYYTNSSLVPMKIQRSQYLSQSENVVKRSAGSHGYAVLSALECSRILSGKLSPQSSATHKVLVGFPPKSKKIPKLQFPGPTQDAAKFLLNHPVFIHDQ